MKERIPPLMILRAQRGRTKHRLCPAKCAEVARTQPLPFAVMVVHRAVGPTYRKFTASDAVTGLAFPGFGADTRQACERDAALAVRVRRRHDPGYRNSKARLSQWLRPGLIRCVDREKWAVVRRTKKVGR